MENAVQDRCDLVRPFCARLERFGNPSRKALGEVRQKIHAGAVSQSAQEPLNEHLLSAALVGRVDQPNQHTFAFSSPFEPVIRPLMDMGRHVRLRSDREHNQISAQTLV
jgi:hypothetical protein